MLVSPDTINMLVRRLANQCPTRYYLDGMHDGTYSHVVIEIWIYKASEFPDSLNKELLERGFTFKDNLHASRADTGDFRVLSWIAEKEVKG